MSTALLRPGMALAGASAALVACGLFLPLFVVLGGHPSDFGPILLIDITCLAVIAGLAGDYLAAPIPGGAGTVVRSTRVSLIAWVLGWGVLIGMGILGPAVSLASGADPSRLIAFLGYAVLYPILLTPVLVALVVQLSLASALSQWVLRTLGVARPARG